MAYLDLYSMFKGWDDAEAERRKKAEEERRQKEFDYKESVLKLGAAKADEGLESWLANKEYRKRDEDFVNKINSIKQETMGSPEAISRFAKVFGEKYNTGLDTEEAGLKVQGVRNTLTNMSPGITDDAARAMASNISLLGKSEDADSVQQLLGIDKNNSMTRNDFGLFIKDPSSMVKQSIADKVSMLKSDTAADTRLANSLILKEKSLENDIALAKTKEELKKDATSKPSLTPASLTPSAGGQGTTTVPKPSAPPNIDLLDNSGVGARTLQEYEKKYQENDARIAQIKLEVQKSGLPISAAQQQEIKKLEEANSMISRVRSSLSQSPEKIAIMDEIGKIKKQQEELRRQYASATGSGTPVMLKDIVAKNKPLEARRKELENKLQSM